MTNKISLGQLQEAVLKYKDKEGNTHTVKFDGSGCEELRKNNDNGLKIN